MNTTVKEEQKMGQEESLKKKRILVVDDDRKILDLLQFKLAVQGYEVATAKDEKEFFAHAFDEKPDLLILDIWLKHKLGTEIYDSLLSFGFDSQVPVIFITALIENSPPRRASNGGKFALFAKPFDFALLLDEVERLISRDSKHSKESNQNVSERRNS